MSAEKSLAIVLRMVDFSESSCVVTLYSRDFGKISALAKGARRRKSPFEAALDVLAVCRIVFLHKSSNALDLLTEAKLERTFRSARSDLDRLYAAYYVVELLNSFTDEHDANPSIFDLTDRTLKELDQGENVSANVLHFELKLLLESGHFPSLDACVVCGQPIGAQTRVAFGMLAGGVMCETCRFGQRKIIRVSRQVIETLQHFVEPDEQWWRTNGLPANCRGELRAVVNHYLAHQLGHKPRLRPYLTGIVT